MDFITHDIIAAWPSILLAWTALTLIAIAPGPTAVAIMGISMGRGRSAGMVFTAGCMTGAFTWATLAGLGLSAWLTSYANDVFILKTIGGLYLLWLGFKSIKSALTPDKMQNADIKLVSARNLYVRGLLLHLTNPKAILGWAAVITLSQTENGSIPVLDFTLMLCLLTTNIIHFAYAFLFASKAAMATYSRARRGIEAVLASVFGYTGIRLLTD